MKEDNKKKTVQSKLSARPVASPTNVKRDWLKIILDSSIFPKIYAIISVLILLATTTFWAILGAKLQTSNSDQLVDPYLFSNSPTFHGALFPGSHSFLIKWPLFLLIKLFGQSAGAFMAVTVGIVLFTVLVLTAIIYRIERRPLVFGTICLSLASVLLLVPALPLKGSLLPVGMAMITTRNLEYVLFIFGLFLITKSRRLKDWRFWLGSLLLCLLVASDKLFLTIGLGGALLALVVYSLTNSWKLIGLSARWLVAGALSGGGAIGILWLISSKGVTNIASGAGAGPYGIVHNFHDLALAGIYGLLGLLTNFGANGAFDTTILKDVPHDVFSRLAGVSGLSFLINFVIFVAGVFAAWRLIKLSLSREENTIASLDDHSKLSAMLIWATLAALGLFVFSNHYYAGDARYLGISLFTLFISAAVYTSKKIWRTDLTVLAGMFLILGIALALPTTFRTYRNDDIALSGINERNSEVAQAATQHPVKVVVGDYWRVIPTKFAAGGKLNVMPLSGCTQPRDVLSSKTWQTDLSKNSFAYLLSFDRTKTSDFPSCSIQKVITAYGRPNASTLIAGSVSNPKETLLFYDRGTHKSAPKSPPPRKSPATVFPISLDELPYSTCTNPTIMSVVAHQDDDLLFMNPDILHSIRSGYCVRTVYVTAGDSGNNKFYWLSRQQGSEAAYSTMLGSKDIWIQRIVELSPHEFITVANPRGNSKISLIFMNLPDGNLTGDGFSTTDFESLAKLQAGKINTVQAVDGQSTYSSKDLSDSLANLMHFYQPTEIFTQADYVSKTYPDHSDHITVGKYAEAAYKEYELQQYNDEVTVPIKYYIGYPIHGMPENISDGDLQDKEAAFFAYASFDGGVCDSVAQCSNIPTYNAYLKRQYQNSQ